MDQSHVDCLWITVMFLSAVWTVYSDGTHSLQRIHWWAGDVISTKKTHLILYNLRMRKFQFLDEQLIKGDDILIKKDYII